MELIMSNIIATIIVIFATELILFFALAIFRTIEEKLEAKDKEDNNEM